MDERAIKRLLVILAVGIIAIFVFKRMMTNTIVNLNMAAAGKNQAAAKLSASQPETGAVPDPSNIVETPANSSVSEVPAQELSSASGVSETR